MKKTTLGIMLIGLISVSVSGEEKSDVKQALWMQWRGPLATGMAPGANPPTSWAENSNILWKVAVPGRGHASPIVLADRIILTTAVETDKTVDPEKVKAMEAAVPEWQRKEARLPGKVLEFVVMALKRGDGSVLWRKTMLEEAPHSGTHGEGSWASGSPVSDGENIYAYFGSFGLYCLSLDGDKKWEKRFGLRKMKMNFGEGTSPALAGDMVIVCQDDESGSFIVALDKKTGAEKWRKERDELSQWSTPLVLKFKGQDQVIVSAAKAIRSYNPVDGAILWQASGLTTNVIPCPVSDGKYVVFMSGFRGSSIMAVDLDKTLLGGDVAGGIVEWRSDKDAAYASSPLLCDGLVYYLKGNEGSLSCLDIATGKINYSGQKLEGAKQMFSSPVGAGGRIYITSKNGITFVVKQGASFEVLAQNGLDDNFTASAAIVGDVIYLRGYKNLYCIGSTGSKQAR